MISDKKVAVANITFSSSPHLRQRLEECFPNSFYNEKKGRLANDELAQFIGNAEILVMGLEVLNSDILSKSPSLKVIAKYGVGIDNINFDLLSKYGIELLHEYGVNRTEVAEFAFAQLLNLLRNISLTGKLLSKGIWLKDGGNSLSEVTVGVIGVGNIGSAIIEMLALNGCRNIVCYDIDQCKYQQVAHLPNVSFAEPAHIFQQSDVLTLHIPGDPANDHFINSQNIPLMKKGVKLLNMSRGSLVDAAALLDGIAAGIIHSAALDVYKYEPFFDARIVNNDRIIVTPHTAGNSGESVRKMGISVINNLIDFYKLNLL